MSKPLKQKSTENFTRVNSKSSTVKKIQFINEFMAKSEVYSI